MLNLKRTYSSDIILLIYLPRTKDSTYTFDHVLLPENLNFYLFILLIQLRKLWSEEKYLPGVPQNEIPDLKSCLLYQQFQVINCCISRKRLRTIATESLDSMLMLANSDRKDSTDNNTGASASPVLYARLNSGELVLRLGADRPAGDTTLLETGEPVYSPVTQV